MITKSLIKDCINREPRAQQLCYKACAPYIYTIVKSYIYNEEYRKDAMQDSFAQIFHSLPSFDENKGSFKNWIAQISIRQCIAILRQNKKLNMFVAMDEKHDNIGEYRDNLDQLNKKDIEKLLSKMPIGYRTVFLLNIIDGLTHREIGTLLNTTAATSRSQLSRGIAWIKKNTLEDSKINFYG